ncbi:hypothetical protein Lal_00032714 [Lupinus albus]|uniref:Uncharacterized protein n=1 Tax=Lupinus albus TaxID=3870 RepID=A0A6A5PLU1_LUPAL|nr:hypothetical protein Lalb_Chr01g0022391 [Lupinus albus]KAF1897952.1 hypothetical protein Lal_00032714 [Lupinus albus]
MDIEPLWDLGGWFFLSKCMALPKTSSPISESFSKSPIYLQILALFFILLILVNLSHQPNPSSMASLEPVQPSSDQSAMSTTNLHPQKAMNKHSSSKDAAKEFGVDAHEVPSGPNPISN